MSDFWQILEQVLSLEFSYLNDFSPLAIFFIILFSTFLTEDGACFAAGALISQGRISWAVGLSACFAGVCIGDIGLYWIGRIFGKTFAKTRIFKYFVSEKSLARVAKWLDEKGGMAIIISRFVSGLRLPTYLVAGFLKTSFPKFAFYFLAATIVWTPILVGSAAFAVDLIPTQYILIAIIGLFIAFRIILTLTSWQKRRFFIGRLKRIRNWEFWSLKVFYFPVFLYVIWLGIKHRSLTVFTCANPAILAGGFVGGSKHEIYKDLETSDFAKHFLLKHQVITKDEHKVARINNLTEFINENNLTFPFVLKPDNGNRGKDVLIVKELSEINEVLSEIDEDYILQEFADGEEFSIFYYRYPSQKNGKIFSITEKQFPTLKDDGKSTLEELILMDERAVALAKKYFEQNKERLTWTPESDEEVKLIEIATHSRGAIFMEGGHLKTSALEQTFDKICKDYKGFYFGKFDIRTPYFKDLKRGENFKIIELNGVTSQSTNIYDKRYSLTDAYKILFKQWKIAFEIGKENYKNGAKKTSIMDLVRLLFGRGIKS